MANKLWRWMVFLLIFLASGCQALPSESNLPTRAVAAATVTPPTASASNQPSPVPPTFTPLPESVLVSPTAENLPSRTPRSTHTPFPTITQTPTETPTASATPTETQTPTNTPIITTLNLLPNPSFEGGWYNLNGVPELQIPNQWTLEWDEGHNPLDPDPWNAFVRPETRVLNFDFLPADEHSTFIWDGSHTVKIFKGEGAISYRLFTSVFLQPGDYFFEINIYPDLVIEYTEAGGKIFADDPLAGELQFIVDVPASTWILPRFGQRNTYAHTFTVTYGRLVKIGLAVRGRWAIENNGWFMDDWSLTQLPDEGN
jgi:hypothetical protein